MDNFNLAEYCSYVEQCLSLGIEPLGGEDNWGAHQSSIEKDIDSAFEGE